MKKRGMKKAQAKVITIILIVLIAIVSLIVVWNFVNPLIKNKSEDIQTSQLFINLEVKEIVLTETGASRVIVERKSGEGELSYLKFIFYDETGLSKSIDETANLPKELETRNYFFSPVPEIGKIKSVSVVPAIRKVLGREFESSSEIFFETPAGLASWWEFSDLKDFFEKNNGILINNAQIINGVLVLDRNGYFNARNNLSLNIDKEVAISSWINADSYDGKIISKGNLNKNYEVSLQPDGKIRFNFAENKYVESSNTIPLNEWKHVVASIDFDGVYKIYIDGNEEHVSSRAENASINNEDLLIGNNFDGKIDNVMIFSKSLTGSNVNYIYKSQKNNF